MFNDKQEEIKFRISPVLVGMVIGFIIVFAGLMLQSAGVNLDGDSIPLVISIKGTLYCLVTAGALSLIRVCCHKLKSFSLNSKLDLFLLYTMAVFASMVFVMAPSRLFVH